MFYEDPKFWVALSFVTFIALMAKPVGRFIASALDGRGARIRAELEEATRLRVEAQELVSAYQKKQRESMEEAEQIVSAAREQALRMGREAESALKATIEARTKAATDKIAQAEAQALKDVQAHVVDVAVAAARTLLIEKAGSLGAGDAVAQAVADLDRKLH